MLFLLENGLLFSARSDIFLLENVVLRCVPTLSYLKMACFSAVFRVRFFCCRLQRRLAVPAELNHARHQRATALA